ncbi:hypothetical protein [Aeromonas phage AerS_266]|nr:hypothetical protein [Aeromonas phage AerS_266]
MNLLGQDGLFSGVTKSNPIESLSKTISESVSGLTSQLINPLKAVGEATNSGVALVSESDSRLVNAVTTFKSINIDKIIQGASDLVGGILNNPQLSNVLSYEDGFKVNSSELLRMASNGLGFNVGSAGDIKQLMGDEFLKELDSMTGGISSGLFFADGTKVSIRDGWQMSVGETLINFLGKENGAFAGIVNIAGVNAVLNTMIRQAAENAMYQSYETFGDQYLFQSDYHDAIINSMEYCIARGDIQSINKMLEIIGKEGLNKVRAQYPDLIERTLAGFYFTADTYEEDYPQLAVLLNTLLVEVGGPDWYKSATEFGLVTNLAVVNSISESAKLLLQDFPQYHPLLCSAGIFNDTSAIDVYLKDFPKAINFQA